MSVLVNANGNFVTLFKSEADGQEFGFTVGDKLTEVSVLLTLSRSCLVML